MNLVNKDRVLVTSTTTGLGAYVVAGVVAGYQGLDAIGDGNSCSYVANAVDASGVPTGDWEVGIGTYSVSGSSLARTRILSSSNSGAAVNWAAGTKRIALTLSARQFDESNPKQLGPLARLTNSRTRNEFQPTANYEVAYPVAGGAPVVLTNRPAGESGIITGVQFSLDGGNATWDARLRVYVDQESIPSIDVDIGTLFVCHNDAHVGGPYTYGTDHIQGSLNGSSSSIPTGASFQMQFPMPYSNGIRIEIYTPAGVDVGGQNKMFSLVYRQDGVTSPMRLRSKGLSRLDAAAGPVIPANSDINVFDMQNACGSLVWWSMACFGGSNWTFLERPYKLYFDGESTPSWITTGGEEYGASGWYFGLMSKFFQPAIIMTAGQNGSYSQCAGWDLLKMHGGLHFENRLRLVWSEKGSPYQSSTSFKFGWCALFYIDTSVPFTPTAPKSLTATGGPAQATFSWSNPDSQGSSPVTGFTLTLTNGGGTYSVAAGTNSKTVTGLTNGVTYAGTVTATNAVGTSAASNTASVTPATASVPGAPTGVSATAGDGQATVTFTAPASNGGSNIIGFTATSTPGGLTGSISGATAAPISVPGLTNGTAYTFTVHATNVVGNSAESSASNSVTPTVSNVIASDNFNRANASTLGSTPVGNKAWTPSASVGVASGNIASNQAYLWGDSPGAMLLATIDIGTSAFDVSVKLATIGSHPNFSGLTARYVDPTHHLHLLLNDPSSATAYILEVQAGTGGGAYTIYATIPVTPAAGDVLRFHAPEGSNMVTVVVNGVEYGPYNCAAASTTATRVGFQAQYTSAGDLSTVRFDDFSVS